MAASVLSIYNSALTMLGQRTLASMSDVGGGESKRLLDRAWCDVRNRCLESGSWSWSLRAVKLEPDDMDPAFGYDHAYEKPCDWIRTHELSADEHMRAGLVRFLDQGGRWYCDANPIYVRYVSCSDQYGGDIGKWTAKFAHAVACQLAAHIAPKATGSSEKALELNKYADRELQEALALDAANLGSQPMPTSSWVNSRRGRWPTIYGSWRP